MLLGAGAWWGAGAGSQVPGQELDFGARPSWDGDGTRVSGCGLLSLGFLVSSVKWDNNLRRS